MTTTAMRRGVFGAGLAAALAFGGAQAMAFPADAARGEARACTQSSCDRYCKSQGAIAGRCTSTGLCACAW